MAVVIAGIQPTFTRDALLHIPSGDGFHVHKFEVIFKHLPGTEIESLRERWIKGEIDQKQLLDEVLVGWKGMRDENGAEVPYSHEERKATEKTFIGTEQAIAVSWIDNAVVASQREAAEKNSKAQSAISTDSTVQAATS